MSLSYHSEEYRRWAARVMVVYKLVGESRYTTMDWVEEHEMHPRIEQFSEIYCVIDKYDDQNL